MVRILWGALMMMGAVLLAGCDQNKFMSKPPSKPDEYKWVAIIYKEDGAMSDCAKTYRRVTIKIKDNVLTIFPYYGYQRATYTADLSSLNPDGSGAVFLKKDSEQEDEGVGENAHLTISAGVGPRHMKLTSRYGDYCKYTIDPE